MADGTGAGGGSKSTGGDMLSSYLGRWMSVVVLVLLAALAAAALFLDPDYPAHVPVRIGVTAFDETCAGDALRSLAARVREDDGGDITWVWLDDDEISGCDFYLMTALQFKAAKDRGIECLLLASPRDDGNLPIGVIVTAGGVSPDWSRMAFTSVASASGFISPLAALAASGTDLSLVSFETMSGGCPLRGDAVAFGVAMGRYGAGGLPLEELRRLEKSGAIDPGRLIIALTGPELPEVVLASDPSTEQWKSAGFARRLPRIAGRISGALRREMSALGMVSLRPPGEGEMELLDNVPDEVWDRAGYHFP